MSKLNNFFVRAVVVYALATLYLQLAAQALGLFTTFVAWSFDVQLPMAPEAPPASVALAVGLFGLILYHSWRLSDRMLTRFVAYNNHGQSA